jgi:AraC family cel operon transcriptional repressor
VRKLLWRSLAAPGQVAHVARRRLAGQWPVPLHTHDFAEVLWVERGRGTHEVGGVRNGVREGDLLLIRPADHHGFSDGEVDFTIVNVAFPAATLRHLRRRYFGSDPGFWGGRGAPPAAYAITPGRGRSLSAASAELARHPRDLLALETFLLNLLHDLAGRARQGTLASCPPWLREACERLRDPEHLGGGVRALARLTGRSSEHVARQLRACAGLRPIDVVTAARLDHATSELALTERPIVDIALECGFESLSHFYRVFRTRLGETPRAYRLRSQAALR